MAFNREWMRHFGWPDADGMHLPLAIAHRGASDYETGNTLAAYRIASELFAEMWHVDVRLSAEGIVVASSKDQLSCSSGRAMRISEAAWSEIRSRLLPGGHRIPRLEEIVDLADQRGAGLYVEAKAPGAAEASWSVLAERAFPFAAIGSSRVEWIAELRRKRCPYPLSVHVPVGVDPYAYGKPARPDMLQLSRRHAGPESQGMFTGEFMSRCRSLHMAVVLGEENCRSEPEAITRLDVLGIRSNRPESLKPSRRQAGRTPAIVCHRGANQFAPENTLEAARICYDQRFDFVEVDIRTTADGRLVALHDATVDRTTEGAGTVAGLAYSNVRELDAGSWFSHKFAGARIPTLEELLDETRGRGGLYIEIKDADPERVLAEVDRRGMLGRVFFSCMKVETMRRMRALSTEAQLMAARWMYPSLTSAVADFQADIVEFELGVDDLAEVPLCAELGVKSMVYSMTHDWEKLRQILETAPDLANLDRPDIFKMLASYPDLANRVFARRRSLAGACRAGE